MSIVLTMVSVATLLTVTTAETISSLINKCEKGILSDPISTRFNNRDLLLKTIIEHGIEAECDENGVITANCQEGMLVYRPDGLNSAYTVRVNESIDVNLLANELNDIDIEYDANVQSYTYEHLIENLPDNMSIEEERVMDDDSILLTIAVNE